LVVSNFFVRDNIFIIYTYFSMYRVYAHIHNYFFHHLVCDLKIFKNICKIINVKFMNKCNLQSTHYRMGSALISAAGWQQASFRVHEIIISLVYNKGWCIRHNYAFGASLFKLYRNSNVCYKCLCLNSFCFSPIQ